MVYARYADASKSNAILIDCNKHTNAIPTQMRVGMLYYKTIKE